MAYSGDLTLFSGTPSNYSVNTTIPSITTEALEFTGGAINGFTKEGTGEALIDASTMADGSVVNLDATLNNNFRLIIRKEWLEANVMPGLAGASGISQFFIGFPAAGADWTALSAGNGNVAAEDFKFAFGIHMTDEAGHDRSSGYKIKMYKDGTQVHNLNVSASPNTTVSVDLVFSYVDGRMEMGVIHAGLYDSATEPREENGGSGWLLLVPYNSFGTGAQTLFLGAQNTQADLALSGLDLVREPFQVRDFLVGETSVGNKVYSNAQPPSSEFAAVSNGHAAFANVGVNPPSVNAGQTYRYIYHPSFEAADKIEFRLASDQTTVYTTGVTEFGSGDPSFTNDYKGLEFAIPSDVPPLVVFGYNDYSGGSYSGPYTLPIAGSTHAVDVTGIDLIGPSGNISGNTLTGNAWFKLTETLGAGERLVIGGAQLQEIYDSMGNGDNVFVGLKGAGWSESSTEADLEGVYLKIHKPSYGGKFLGIYGDYGTGFQYAIDSYDVSSDWSAFIELTSTGNNIRIGTALNTSVDPATTIYSNWPSNSGGQKNQTGDQGFGYTTEDVVFYFKRFAQDLDTANVTWSDLQEVANPSVATILTPFTKALDFSGSSERVKQVSSSTDYMPLAMNGLAATTSAPAGGVTTSLDGDSRPWATAVVFKADGNNSNQHIWNQGEGEGTGNDNIYVRLSASKNLYFGWGRDGDLNECQITSGGTIATNQWYGLYVAHNGTRLSAGDATAANLADCFDIYLMSSADNFNVVGNNLSTESTWLNTGDRMDRTVAGDFTIGGRGSNRSFHGKVASMVVTVLRRSFYMPDEAEIKTMITDPKRWEDDYRVGQTVRQSAGGGNTGYTPSSVTGGYGGTQIWLMGDGTSDAFAQIRNQVYVADQNHTPLNMVSMVSSDIETVNISGLT